MVGGGEIDVSSVTKFERAKMLCYDQGTKIERPRHARGRRGRTWFV